MQRLSGLLLNTHKVPDYEWFKNSYLRKVSTECNFYKDLVYQKFTEASKDKVDISMLNPCKNFRLQTLFLQEVMFYTIDVPEFAEYGVLMPVFDAKFKSHTEPMDKIENIWVDTIKTVLFNKEIRLKYSTSGLERARQFDIDKTIIEWRKALETL